MKLRLRSTKLGKVRFTSHRDVARMWERALRRCELPVAMSAGFTPRPRIGFGLALPTGAESIAEYIDIDIDINIDIDIDAGLTAGGDTQLAGAGALDDLAGRLSAALPFGFDVLAAAIRPPGDSLQEAVVACTWQLSGPGIEAHHHLDACRLLEADTLVLERERKGKRSADDVRPLIRDLRVLSDANDESVGARLVAELVTSGRGLRPSELAQLAYPRVDPLDVRVLRTHQWIMRDGALCEVLSTTHPLASVASASPVQVLA